MIALVTDLIFSTKITSTAASMGVKVKVVRSMESLEERLNSGANDRVALVDLTADGVDVIAAIERLRAAANPPRIIAYAPHVQVDAIQAARRAGADEVMARSAFVAKLPVILTSEGEQQ